MQQLYLIKDLNKKYISSLITLKIITTYTKDKIQNISK